MTSLLAAAGLVAFAGCGGEGAGEACGNGKVEGAELCDDGTQPGTIGAGACTGTCTWQEHGPGGTGSAMYPAVAMNPAGDYVLAWRAADAEADENIWAAAYRASGALAVPPFQVNVGAAGYQQYPTVGIDGDGRFVVAWHTDPLSPGATEGNVWMRAFDADGAPLTGDVQLNTYTDGPQTNANVAVSPSGTLVAAWSSYGQDGDLTGVYAVLGDSSGQIQTAEPFQVNTETANTQENPWVGLAADGRFVIAWESTGQESS